MMLLQMVGLIFFGLSDVDVTNIIAAFWSSLVQCLRDSNTQAIVSVLTGS